MLIATLSVATDLALGVPLEHRLRSTPAAMRLCDTSGVDQETASQTYFLCLLFYVGCTASVDLDPDTFGDDDGLTAYALPSRFGKRPEILGGSAGAGIAGWVSHLSSPTVARCPATGPSLSFHSRRRLRSGPHADRPGS